ncbi:MAG: lysylphosphatidylglycerol synthase transmembrane domain-containing protein [Myxococcota bacterium]
MAEPGAATAFRDGPPARWAPPAIRIAGLACFVLYSFIGPLDVQTTIEALRGLDPGSWLLAFGFNLAPPLLIALRLKGLLADRGYAVGYGVLARDALRSLALNTVAIMGVGDLYRVNRLRVAGVPIGVGGATALVDRLFGIGTLVVLAGLFQAVGLGSAVDGVGVAIAAFAVVVAVVFVRFARSADGRLASLLRVPPPSGAVFLRSVGLSGLTVVAWIVSVACLGEGLALGVPLAAYFAAAPLVALASFLPITVGGVGLREAGYVLLLAAFGASPEACVALGLAQYSTLLGVASVGGLFFLRPDREIDAP